MSDSSLMDLSAMADLDETYGLWTAPAAGVGRSLNTPPPPVAVTAALGPFIGVGTRVTVAPSNVTMGVGTTQALRQLAEQRRTTGQKTIPAPAATPAACPTAAGKQPRRVPRQTSPHPAAVHLPRRALAPHDAGDTAAVEIVFSTKPKCSNSWKRFCNSKRPRVAALQASQPRIRSRPPIKTDVDPP